MKISRPANSLDHARNAGYFNLELRFESGRINQYGWTKLSGHSHNNDTATLL